MAVLAILQPDARLEARVSEALAGPHRVLRCAAWSEFERTLRDIAVDGCIVDGDHPDRERALHRLSTLRERAPELALIVVVGADQTDRAYELGARGVDGVLTGAASSSKLRADVDRALSVSRARRVRRALEGRLEEPGPSVVSWAVEHAGPETSVERLAAALGRSSAALREDLQAAGLPAPGRLLVWGRMIQAGARLGDDGRRAEEVAFALGYSTATAFARALKLNTGLTVAEVPEGEGMTAVLDLLVERSGAEGERGGSFGRRAMAPLVAFATVLLLPGCAAFGGTSVDRSAIEGIVDAPPIGPVHTGILAVDAETGRTLYSRDAHREHVPASNQKIGNVNSLSGYLVQDDGRKVIFSVLTNGSGLPTHRVRAAIDDVAPSLAR